MLFRRDTIPTAARAALASLRQAWRGPVFAPRDVQDYRMARCSYCPANVRGQCVRCTCFVYLKTSLSAESCPLRLWGPYTSGHSLFRRVKNFFLTPNTQA